MLDKVDFIKALNPKVNAEQVLDEYKVRYLAYKEAYMNYSAIFSSIVTTSGALNKEFNRGKYNTDAPENALKALFNAQKSHEKKKILRSEVIQNEADENKLKTVLSESALTHIRLLTYYTIKNSTLPDDFINVSHITLFLDNLGKKFPILKKCDMYKITLENYTSDMHEILEQKAREFEVENPDTINPIDIFIGHNPNNTPN